MQWCVPGTVLILYTHNSSLFIIIINLKKNCGWWWRMKDTQKRKYILYILYIYYGSATNDDQNDWRFQFKKLVGTLNQEK